MKINPRIASALIMGAILIPAALFLVLDHGRLLRSTRTFPVMGTVAVIDLYDNSAEELESAVNDAQNAIYEVEKICNVYDEASELSRLNATAYKAPFPCSDLLWDVLKEARFFYEFSDGAFDITVKPLMRLWGFHRKRSMLPTAKEISETMKYVGFDKVILDDSRKTVRFAVDGIGLDLGGIAKGYALDRAAKRVLDRGIRIGILDLGGNLRCLPQQIPSSDREYYQIGIQNPVRKTELMTKIPLRNSVIATSGDYERYVTIGGRHYTHIINPATGLPVENMLSVSIVTRRGVVSDALSTSLFVRPELAGEVMKAFPGTQILIVRRNENNPKQIIVESFGRIWENVETIRKQLN